MSFVPLLLATAVLSYALCSAGTPVRSVLVIRHCARATDTGFSGDQAVVVDGVMYTRYDDFTGPSRQPFPTFPVPAYQCLDRGLQLVSSMGANFAAHQPFPGPVTTIADNSDRDVQTAIALLRGMGLPQQYEVMHEVFDPVDAGLCPQLPANTVRQAMEDQFAKMKPLPDRDQMLQMLQGILMQGRAPPLYNINDTINDSSNFVGGTEVAGAIMETFLMQFAGGLPFAWKDMSEYNLYKALRLHYFQRQVQHRALPLVRYGQSTLLNTVVQALRGNGTGSTILVGHDGDMDGLATLLGLSWSAAPFPDDATLPGAGLRFDLNGTPGNYTVTINYVFTTFYDTQGDILTSPADFVDRNNNTMPFTDFVTRAMNAMDTTCVVAI